MSSMCSSESDDDASMTLRVCVPATACSPEQQSAEVKETDFMFFICQVQSICPESSFKTLAKRFDEDLKSPVVSRPTTHHGSSQNNEKKMFCIALCRITA